MNMLVAWAVFVKLVLGSCYYFFQKMIVMTCGYPSYDDPTPVKSKCPTGMSNFDKTFFLSTVVFGSMCFSLFFFYFWRKKKCDPAGYSRKMVLLMIIPGVIECVAFCLGIYAQIIMALSLSMIMKGAKVVFSAIFTVTFLKHKLYAFHWFAVGLCLAGLAVAGGSEYLNDAGNIGTVILGISMMLTAECLKAFHLIFEERMFKTNNCDVTFVVGFEGVYSCALLIPMLLFAWLVIPGDQGGSLENLADTFYRIGNSALIWGLLSTYPVVVLLVAISGAMLTKHLSGVHNALISVCRVVVVWALELIFFYCASPDVAKQYGVGWKEYTYLKLIGFICVVVATLIYDEDIKIPYLFAYPSGTPIMEDELKSSTEIIIVEEEKIEMQKI